MANHQQFSSVFSTNNTNDFFTARHTQQKQELSKFRPAQICLVMVVGKNESIPIPNGVFFNGDLASHGRSNLSKTSA